MPTSSFFRQFITHIHQKLNLLIFHRTIQRNTQPMGLIHVPAREDSQFLPEGANQSGITFKIHHTDFTLVGQAQILSGDVHDYSKPLPVLIVPEHQKAWILGEEMLALCTIDFRYVGFQFPSLTDRPLSFRCRSIPLHSCN